MLRTQRTSRTVSLLSFVFVVNFQYCISSAAAYSLSSNEVDDSTYLLRSKYAGQMLSFMNFSIDPCDDFYEFACGNWKNIIEEHQSQSKRTYLTDIDYELAKIAEMLLEEPNILGIAPEYNEEFQLTKKFYHECLETDLQSNRKSVDYINVILQIGGFPALDPAWDASTFSWVNMSAHMSNYGINGLMRDGLVPEYPFQPYFDLPTFGFDIELHTDSIQDSNSSAYQSNYQRMHDLLSLYEVEAEHIPRITDDIFEMLNAIFAVFEEFDENEFVCKNITSSLDESTVEAINITWRQQWRNYLDIAWNNPNLELDDDYKPCDYLYYKLETICGEHKEAVANYLALKFLHELDPKLKDVKYQKEYCVSRMRSVMTFLFDQLFMKIYSNEELFDEVNAMIDDIKSSLSCIIKQADWLDEETRQEALLKEANINKVIGRYETPETVQRLIGEMRNLEFIDGGNYEANNLNLKKFEQYIDRYNGLHAAELNNSTKPLQLLMGMQANAFYYNNDNSMYVMAGVLNPPMFDKAWPNSLKYGTLGYLVGHELTHALDTVGAKYDHTGNKRYWWTEYSDMLFKDRAQCFVDYFNQYHVPEINRNINGNGTRDENIADAGGLRVALLAYRHLRERMAAENPASVFDDSDERMPALDFTPDQLFFLGTAQIWCSSYTEANYWEQLSDEHTIDKYRVLGMVSNNADFAQAYNCPLGSKMNPVGDKCIIW
ncbi:neprilysin-1 [Musca vetustissima]|uniref:neprilysin-1 n=1 Tax=Musca vetustissima TaxID=27455 RepID=UPI002AB6D28A|nr:neprilysin-1 [Musca vetustissima]